MGLAFGDQFRWLGRVLFLPAGHGGVPSGFPGVAITEKHDRWRHPRLQVPERIDFRIPTVMEGEERVLFAFLLSPPLRFGTD